MGRDTSENVLGSRRVTFEHHQDAEKQADVRPVRSGGLGNL